MRKFLLIASAAAMAASMPAIAEKGGGKGGGGGNGGGKGQAAQVHGGGGGHGGGKAQKVGGGNGGGQAKAPKVERQSFGGGGGAKPAKAERQAMRGGGGGKPDKAQRGADWGGGKPAKAVKQAMKQDVKRQEQFARDSFRSAPALTSTLFGGGDGRLAGSQGCPPGLANKNNGCLPPGQAKKVFGLGDRLQPTWFSGYQLPEQYRAFYSDTPDYYYRYNDDGYIYRVERESNLISGLVPLLGGGFAVGQPLPSGYDVYNVPYQYRDMYQDSDESYYRYGDDAIYRVDAESGIIESIVALLGGGGLNVGQQLPTGYDAYNLPLDYRDQYADGEDYNYRYADGNIYQVDTKTQIIQAIMEMLV
jgi:hypothetical protein